MRRYLVGKMKGRRLEGVAWAFRAAGTSNAKPPAFPDHLVLIDACVNVLREKAARRWAHGGTDVHGAAAGRPGEHSHADQARPSGECPIARAASRHAATKGTRVVAGAEELRRRQFGALIGWTIASARVQPLVLAFEDLHWADPTTLDVLRGLAERGVLAPLFIVATARPEFRPPWSIRSHHSTISLAPLDRSQVRDMVAELSARHALPQEVVEDVAARTGGVPLFVEEVTRLLLERGGEQGGIHAIPPTLQQSLTARLDAERKQHESDENFRWRLGNYMRSIGATW